MLSEAKKKEKKMYLLYCHGDHTANLKIRVSGQDGFFVCFLFWAVPLRSLWDFRVWVQSMFEDLAVGAQSPAWTTREFPMDNFILRLF